MPDSTDSPSLPTSAIDPPHAQPSTTRRRLRRQPKIRAASRRCVPGLPSPAATSSPAPYAGNARPAQAHAMRPEHPAASPTLTPSSESPLPSGIPTPPKPSDPPSTPPFPDLDSLLRKPPPQRNPHPWPLTSRSKRSRAIRAAAEDCFARGLSRYQTSVLVRDWDSLNPRPMTNMEAGYPIALVYESHLQDAADTAAAPALVPLSEHRSDSILPREWLIPGLLPAGQRTGLLGRWESGKSWLALDIAMSVAFGTKFLGDTEPAKRGNVVIVDGEGGQSRAIRRFNRLALAPGLAASAHQAESDRQTGEIYWHSPQDLSLSAGDAADQLARLLKPFNPVLVIIDTLAKVMGLADENSNAAASKVTKALYTLNQELGAALLLLSHPAKTETGDPTVRGAGELSADLDVLWHIQRSPENVLSVTSEKDRDADLQSARFAFTMVDSGISTRLERRKPATSRDRIEAAIWDTLIAASPKGVSRTEIAAAVAAQVGFGRTNALNTVRNMVAGGKIDDRGHRLFIAV